MRKKRSERKPVEGDTMRRTRNRTRQQQDEEPAPSRIEPLHLLRESSPDRSSSLLYRNPDVQSREMDPSLEETLLAFLDTHGARDVEDMLEDKLTFLDATFARCGVRADATVPTEKIVHAIYHIVQESQSVELTMASFQLLKVLEKRHPRVVIATEEADDCPGQTALSPEVDRRVWSPIEYVIQDNAIEVRMLAQAAALEAIPLHLLTLVEKIETMVMQMPEGGSQLMNRVSNVEFDSHYDVKIAGHFLMLQHLIRLIQRDYDCHFQVYEETMDTSAVQKSYLYRLLCALPSDLRKTFLSNLVSLLKPRQMKIEEEVPDDKRVDDCLTGGRDAEARNKPERLPSTSDFSHLAYRLLLMWELLHNVTQDTMASMKKTLRLWNHAESLGSPEGKIMDVDHVVRHWKLPENSRSQRRGSFPDDILCLFNNARDLEAYLEALDSPWTKLRFIVDYVVTNAPSDMVVRGLKDSIDRDTIGKLLACFVEDKTEKFVHKFREDVLPVVLAHAFQASLIIHVEAATEDPDNEQLYQAKLLEASQYLVDTLNQLRQLERQEEMLPVAEHVIQMAESILAS